MIEKNKASELRRILEMAQSMILNKDLNGFSDLFAVDGVLELPFSSRKSKRIIQGRENIRAYLTGIANSPLKPTAYKSMTIYETNDPDVIIAEYDLCGEVVATESPYHLRYLQIFRIRNDKIMSLRDYWNPLGIPEVLNRLPEFFDAFSQK